MIAGCLRPSPGSDVRYADRSPTGDGYLIKRNNCAGGCATGCGSAFVFNSFVTKPRRASANSDRSAGFCDSVGGAEVAVCDAPCGVCKKTCVESFESLQPAVRIKSAT